MKKKESEQPLEEYKFHYRNSGCTELSDKFFMAHDLEEAIGMFDYACDKRHLDTEVTEVCKWNRWISKWEKFDLHEYCDGSKDLDLHFKFKSEKDRINFSN